MSFVQTAEGEYMKKLIIIITALAIATTPCMAINKEWSAALGFLGGVVATKAFDNHREHYERHNVYYCPPPQTVYVVQSGHWEVIQEKVWVPGQWIFQEIGPNTYKKVWQEGYYKIVEKRVWVQE